MMAVTGLCNGYIAVLVITALQRLSPKAMMGRVMSLVMLAMVGLGPISQVLAGAIIKVSVIGLFASAGVGMLLTGVLVFAQRSLWRFPAAEQGDALPPTDRLTAA